MQPTELAIYMAPDPDRYKDRMFHSRMIRQAGWGGDVPEFNRCRIVLIRLSTLMEWTPQSRYPTGSMDGDKVVSGRSGIRIESSVVVRIPVP